MHFASSDRLLFIQLYRWFPSILEAMKIVRPETLIRWHRAGFRRYWRWKSRSLGGRPRIAAHLQALIRQMSVENSLWGAPHIHGELLKLGFVVAQSTVAKYMAKKGGPSGQNWSTFLRNHAPHCSHGPVRGSQHLLQRALCAGCPAGSSRACVDQRHTASDSGMGCAANYRSLSLEGGPALPDPRSRRNYGAAVTRRLRAMGIRDKPVALGHRGRTASPRLIGSIRRECVDHILVLGEAHLRRKLRSYACYYNEWRVHRSLNKDAPFHRATECHGVITSTPVLGGLHHYYCRI